MSSPGKPYASHWSSSTINLKWNLNSTNSDISHFNVKYQAEGEKRWRTLDTSSTECSIVVSELQDETNYIFKVRCVMDDDTEGPFGETSDAIRTAIRENDSDEFREDNTSQIPGQPERLETTSTSILLGWSLPKTATKYEHFEVKYKLKEDSFWQNVTTKDQNQLFTDLKSDSTYLFRVRIVFDNGDEGPFSPISDGIKTSESLALKLKKTAKIVDNGVPEIYQIPVIEHGSNLNAKTRKCTVFRGNIYFYFGKTHRCEDGILV